MPNAAQLDVKRKHKKRQKRLKEKRKEALLMKKGSK